MAADLDLQDVKLPSHQDVSGEYSNKNAELESEKLNAEIHNSITSTTSSSQTYGQQDRGQIVANEKLEHNRCLFDPLLRYPPTPPPASMDDAKELPLATASFLSKITFWWIQPLLILGAKRTLHASDLYKMDESRTAGHLADLFEKNFAKRRLAVDQWNTSIDDGTMNPSIWRRASWKLSHSLTGFGSPDGKRKVGIALALSDTFFFQFWTAGLFKVVGDIAQVCSPLITRSIIYFVADSGFAYKGVPGYTAPPVAQGAGLVIGLFLLQIIYS